MIRRLPSVSSKEPPALTVPFPPVPPTVIAPLLVRFAPVVSVPPLPTLSVPEFERLPPVSEAVLPATSIVLADAMVMPFVTVRAPAGISNLYEPLLPLWTLRLEMVSPVSL